LKTTSQKTPSQDEKPKRAPLNLCIVLDRSGSMSSNQKLEFAKEAVKRVILSLNAQDLLHLVVYDDNAETIFENGNLNQREVLLKLVEDLHTRGSTNLSGGLKEGENLINKHHRENYSRRIFLFSDGLANVGIQNHDEMNKFVKDIYERGTKIDPFGIGADFDAKMMKNIGEYAGGEFFFLETAQSIPIMVGKSLENLLTAIGTDGNLKIMGKTDCIVRKIYQHSDLIGGAKLGDIHSDNLRQILCEIEIATTKTEKEIQVLTYELSYLPSKEGENQTRVTSTGILNFQITTDDSLLKLENLAVQVFLVIQQSADSDLEIQKFVQNHDSKSAISAQEKQISQLKSVLHLDQTGMVQLLLKISENTLEKLKVEGTSRNMEQNYSHQNYMKMKGSMKYVDHYS